MKVLVTGASGFLGKSVVRAVADAGHEVLALVRPGADVAGIEWPSSITVIRGDLRQTPGWANALDGVEAVAHLAAATSGDLATQLSGTVVTTENLLNALDLGKLKRMVHVSSFSVYDFSAVSGRLTETAPLQSATKSQDAYTVAKVVQERCVTDRCNANEVDLVVLRPGLIYGPGKDWEFGRALRAGNWDILFAPGALMPLTYVDNCADAVVCALTANVASGTICNVVDDQLPSRRQYHRLCRESGMRTGTALGIPWWLVRALGLVGLVVEQVFFGGNAKLPDIVAWRRQPSRWKPLQYPNGQIRRRLGWLPQVALHEGIAKTLQPLEHYTGPGT